MDNLIEKAAPGTEKWASNKKVKAAFQKRYGDNWKAVLYGHSWNMAKAKKEKNKSTAKKAAQTHDLRKTFNVAPGKVLKNKPVTGRKRKAGVSSALVREDMIDYLKTVILEHRGKAKPKAAYRITLQTSNKSLGKLAKRQDNLGLIARAELKRRLKAKNDTAFSTKPTAAKYLEAVLKGKKSLDMPTATKLIGTLKIPPKSALAKTIRKIGREKISAKSNMERRIKKIEKNYLERVRRDRAINAEVEKRLEQMRINKSAADADEGARFTPRPDIGQNNLPTAHHDNTAKEPALLKMVKKILKENVVNEAKKVKLTPGGKKMSSKQFKKLKAEATKKLAQRKNRKPKAEPKKEKKSENDDPMGTAFNDFILRGPAARTLRSMTMASKHKLAIQKALLEPGAEEAFMKNPKTFAIKVIQNANNR